MNPSSPLPAEGHNTAKPSRWLSTPVLQTNQTQFSLGQCKARLLHQGCSYMNHHLSHPCFKVFKRKINWNGSLFYYYCHCFSLPGSETGQLALLKGNLPFGRGQVWRTLPQIKKMPESYEQRNERFLQAKQFCHLGCAFSSCCSDKNLFLRELSFQPESITFAFKRDCKSPPISLLHSFPVFAAHIFTVSTFSQLWIQIGKLWTARQGPAVSLWRRKSFEFLLPQPPSTKYFIQALCYHLITQHLELTGVSSTNTTMEWEWMHEGMSSLKEEHPNALSACSRAGFLQAPSN